MYMGMYAYIYIYIHIYLYTPLLDVLELPGMVQVPRFLQPLDPDFNG